MDAFISHINTILSSSGQLATRLFPSEAQVLRMFAERIISDVIGEAYVQPLLSRAREAGGPGATGMGLFLRASAAVFAMTERIIEVVVDAGKKEGNSQSTIRKEQVEDLMCVCACVIYRGPHPIEIESDRL